MTGDGYMSLVEDSFKDAHIPRENRLKPEVKSKLPYDLHLDAVLGMCINYNLFLSAFFDDKITLYIVL